MNYSNSKYGCGQMRIAIIGAGAMGTAIGAYITRAGYAVDMVDANMEQVGALKRDGAVVRHSDPSKDFSVPVSALVPRDMSGIYDLIVLTTKQTANAAVLPSILPRMNEDSVICTLQNGVPEPYVAEIVGNNRVVGGSMHFGAELVEPGVTRITTEYSRFRSHAMQIGEISGNITERIRKTARVFGAMGNVEVTTNLMGTKWFKLLVNSSRSGMSAALGCTFGETVSNPVSLACSLFIAKECIDVCRAEGIMMVGTDLEDPSQYYWQTPRELAKSMERFKADGQAASGLKASMLQDLEKGRPTEIDYINGYVVQRGNAHGIPTPFNSLVVDIVRQAQENGVVNDMSKLSRFYPLLIGYKSVIGNQTQA